MGGQTELAGAMIDYLKHNETTMKSFVLLRDKPTFAAAEEVGSGGPIHVVVPADAGLLVDSSEIRLFATRVEYPAEYSIEAATEDNVFAVFIPRPDDGSVFTMAALAAPGHTALTPLPAAPDSSYRWDKLRRRMLSSRSESIHLSSSSNPEIRDSFEVLENDLSVVLLEDRVRIKAMMQYVDAAFEAMLKYIQTGGDRAVFKAVIRRRDFLSIERRLRRYLWNFGDLALRSLVLQIGLNADHLAELPESPDREAFVHSLKVLKDFVSSLHPPSFDDVRLDSEHIVEATRGALNAVVRASVGGYALSDPLSDLFTVVAITPLCDTSQGPRPSKETVLAHLESLPAFNEQRAATQTFIRDMAIEARSAVRASCKRLVSHTKGAHLPIHRSLRLVCALLEAPDLAVANLVGVALGSKGRGKAWTATLA